MMYCDGLTSDGLRMCTDHYHYNHHYRRLTCEYFEAGLLTVRFVSLSGDISFCLYCFQNRHKIQITLFNTARAISALLKR